MKQGKMLEILVSLIEKTLQEYDYVEVRHDVYLLDKDGIKRQIDVLLEVDLGARLDKLRIIVECKDRTSKVTMGEVGSFLNLIESLNVSKGIIVSKLGFQSGAVKKANGSNGKVLLYSLNEITSNEVVEWISGPIYRHGYRVDPSKMTFSLTTDAKLEFDHANDIMQAKLYLGDEPIGTFNEFTLKMMRENTDVIRHFLSKEALQLSKTQKNSMDGSLRNRLKTPSESF